PHFRIGKVMLVVAEAGRGLPEAVTHLENLIVLGVHHVFGQRQPLGIVRDDGREILIHDAFETCAVTVERNGARGSTNRHGRVAREGCGDEGEGAEDRTHVSPPRSGEKTSRGSITSVTTTVATSAPAQIRSRLTPARRRSARPSLR